MLLRWIMTMRWIETLLSATYVRCVQQLLCYCTICESHVHQCSHICSHIYAEECDKLHGSSPKCTTRLAADITHMLMWRMLIPTSLIQIIKGYASNGCEPALSSWIWLKLLLRLIILVVRQWSSQIGTAGGWYRAMHGMHGQEWIHKYEDENGVFESLVTDLCKFALLVGITLNCCNSMPWLSVWLNRRII